MAGTRRNKKQVISDEIQKIQEKLVALDAKAQALKEKKETLVSELAAITEAEAKAEEEAKAKEIIQLMNEKGLTLDEIKAIIDQKN